MALAGIILGAIEIGLVGVLIPVLIFAVSGITNRGDAAACNADFKTVQVAQEANFAQTGAYAPTVEALVGQFLAQAPSSDKYAIGTDGSGKVFAYAPTDSSPDPNGGSKFCDAL